MINEQEKSILEQAYEEGYRWIAKDSSEGGWKAEDVCVYIKKPVWNKIDLYWENTGDGDWEYADDSEFFTGFRAQDKNLFNFITPDEKGIYNIEKLLKGEK